MKILVRTDTGVMEQWDIGLLFEDETGYMRKDIIQAKGDVPIYKERKDFEKLIRELEQQIENYNKGDNVLFEEMFGNYRYVSLTKTLECKWKYADAQEEE